MRLFTDTETSGFRRDKLPAEDPNQPHMVQLAAKLFDMQWRCTGQFVCLIQPEGWEIEQQAEQAHKIPTLRCARHGVPLKVALAMLQAFVMNARQVIGHNLAFDWETIISSCYRVGGDALWLKKRAAMKVCTMNAATPICQLPYAEGRPGFKFPSLEEAHHFLLPGVPYHTTHDAMEDLDATVRVFRALQKHGAVPEPLIGGSTL